MKQACVAIIALMSAAVLTVPAGAVTFVTIGTGGVTGVYYPTGQAIAKMINVKRDTFGYKVTAEATGGSVFNINALMTGDLNFALAQSDRVAQAWRGLTEWKSKGRQTDLRGVFALHPETVCLIASVDSGIKQCSDMKGKMVAIGNPGSGTRQNSIDALATCGLTIEDLGKAEGLKAAEGAGLLQDGRLDAYFDTVGHPNGSIQEAAAGRTKVRFVPFPDVGELLQKKPFYSRAEIPVDLYPGVENTENVPTFGVKACFVTSGKTPIDMVYAVTKEIFTNFESFKKLHPAFSNLKKEDMVKGVPAPFHPGAVKYFKEVGLDKHIDRKQ